MVDSLQPGAAVHIMGIGGFGMSAIARVMHEMGYRVSGCDMQPSTLIPPLQELGIPIEIGHSVAHIEQFKPDALVISSAIPLTNDEVTAATARDIPVLKRMDILRTIMAGKTGVAIAGTHGKTTTTAMTAYVLRECGLDPTFIVGGIIQDYGTNAAAGQGAAFVIEADEYDRMFMGLRPQIAVLSTLELDHPDMFDDLDAVRGLFDEFIELLPDDGLLLASQDSEETQRIAAARKAAGKPVITYGLERVEWGLTGWQVSNIEPDDAGGMQFVVERLTYTDDDEITVEAWQGELQLPGDHNVANGLAAIAVAVELGVAPKWAVEALKGFSGAGRRFELKGEERGVTVIDDYAHHPTAIEATLAAARDRYGDRSIWAVWQPHTYSRTKALLDEFARSFYDSDHVIITDIFRSRDKETYGIGPADVLEQMDYHPDARHIGTLDDVVRFLAMAVQEGDVVIVMSAGDATWISGALLGRLSN